MKSLQKKSERFRHLQECLTATEPNALFSSTGDSACSYLSSNMQAADDFLLSQVSRRSFLKMSALLAGSGPLLVPLINAHAVRAQEPLMVYIGMLRLSLHYGVASLDD